MELVLPWLQLPLPLCKLEMVSLLKGKSPPELSVLYELEKVHFFSSWTQPSPRHIVYQVKCGLDVCPSLAPLPSPLLSWTLGCSKQSDAVCIWQFCLGSYREKTNLHPQASYMKTVLISFQIFWRPDINNASYCSHVIWFWIRSSSLIKLVWLPSV